MRTTPRRILPALFTASLVLAACGGSDDDGDDASTDTEAPVETEAPAETEAPVETEAPAATEAPVETDAPVETEAPLDTEAPVETEAPTESAPVEGAAGVALSEWAIDAPTEYAAGTITFTASNGGSFPHELVVIAGESYESLPLEEGGKVIEEELPTGALIGRTDRISSGQTADLTVDLVPGSYVLVCNLGGGDTSHAGAGQRLDITVTG